MSRAAADPRLLDVRRLAGPERPALIFSTFDGLAPEESFVLVSDHPPRPLLGRFQAERPGLFEWSPLEEGPEVWRTEITRRQAEAGASREVTEALSWDHDRLDALEREAFTARAAGDLERAASVYRLFAHGLRRHIGFEEHVLFPEFEARLGMPPDAGPTAVMRAEHREIESLIERIEEGIGDPAGSMVELRARLHDVLGQHNVKEEQVLYPGTDRALSAAERDELVRRIQAYSE